MRIDWTLISKKTHHAKNMMRLFFMPALID